MVRRSLWAAAVCACACAGPPAAAVAATPDAGARYDGKNAKGPRVFVEVARNGARLSDYLLVTRVRCNDGSRRTLGLVERGEGPAGIDSEGRFSYTGKPGRVTFRSRGRRVTGRARTTFNGAFTGSGDVVRGTIESSFRSRRLRCRSGTTRYRAFLDGTRRAPFRDRRLATGRYSADGRRIDFRRFTVLAPGREITRLRFRWRARCSSGASSASTFAFRRLRLRGSRLTLHDRNRARLGRGFTSRRTYRLRLRFFQRGGAYRVRGDFRVSERIFRRGRQVDTCATGLLRFRGRFRGGPTNRF